MNKKTIVIFDFDGTITKNDTMLHLAKWHFGLAKFCFGMLKIVPQIFLYKIGIISNTKAKEAFISHFYGGMSYQKFSDLCKSYSLSMIDKIIKPEAQKRIEFHKYRGDKMIIITASALEWVQPWASKSGFDNVLASQVEVIDSKLSGKIEGKNCYGAEKVNRFIKEYGPLENYHTICFGDSSGDQEILANSNQSYYKKYE